MRVLVCGGRDFGKLSPPDRPDMEEKRKEYRFLMSKLDWFAFQHSEYADDEGNWLPTDIEIISGCATGADSVAIDWGVVNWCKIHEFPADWEKYGRAAGPIRNQQMLDEGKPDAVLAFHNDLTNSRGTADMLARARKAKIPLIEVYSSMFPAVDTDGGS